MLPQNQKLRNSELYVLPKMASGRIVIVTRWFERQMSVAGRMVMQLVSLFFALIIAAPLMLYGSPIIMYVIPFIVVGLALSLIVDSVRHHSRDVRH